MPRLREVADVGIAEPTKGMQVIAGSFVHHLDGGQLVGLEVPQHEGRPHFALVARLDLAIHLDGLVRLEVVWYDHHRLRGVSFLEQLMDVVEPQPVAVREECPVGDAIQLCYDGSEEARVRELYTEWLAVALVGVGAILIDAPWSVEELTAAQVDVF